MDINELLRIDDEKRGRQCTLTLEDGITPRGVFVKVMVRIGRDGSILSADLILNSEGRNWPFANNFIKDIKFDEDLNNKDSQNEH